MVVNSLPKTVTRQRRGCDLNPGPTAPESNMLTTRLPSHPMGGNGSLKINSRSSLPHRQGKVNGGKSGGLDDLV